MEKTTALSSSLVNLFRHRHQIPTNPPFISYSRKLKVIVNVSSLSVEQLKQPETKGGDGKDEAQIRGIEVPRQRYINISKSDLLDALLLLFDSQLHKHHFLRLSSCLDSIIHAEHKRILEDMRLDYYQKPPHDSSPKENFNNLKSKKNMEDGKEQQHTNGDVEQLPSSNVPNPLISTIDLSYLLRSLPENGNRSSTSKNSSSGSRRWLHMLSLYNFDEENIFV